MDDQDLSNKTIFALAMLALIVSFIGAWVSITAAGSADAQPVPREDAGQGSGEISLKIDPLNRGDSSGIVALEIAEPPEE